MFLLAEQSNIANGEMEVSQPTDATGVTLPGRSQLIPKNPQGGYPGTNPRGRRRSYQSPHRPMGNLRGGFQSNYTQAPPYNPQRPGQGSGVSRNQGTPYPNTGNNYGRFPYTHSQGPTGHGGRGGPPPHRGPSHGSNPNYGYGPSYGPRPGQLEATGLEPNKFIPLGPNERETNYEFNVSTYNKFFPLQDRDGPPSDFEFRNNVHYSTPSTSYDSLGATSDVVHSDYQHWSFHRPGQGIK